MPDIPSFDPISLLPAEAPPGAVPILALDAAGFARWRDSAAAAAAAWAGRSGFKGGKGEVVVLPDGAGGASAVLVGLGREAQTDDPDLWLWAGVADQLAPGDYRLPEEMGEEAARHAALGWVLAQYRFARYLGEAPQTATKTATKTATGAAPKTLAVLAPAARAEAVSLAEAAGLVRDLVNTPANDMLPRHLADAARDLAQAYDAEVSVIEGEGLLEQGFPAIHAVGRASADAPRLIDLKWGDPDAPKLTLVGKGVCFDSGGLNLKGGSGMRLMKKDMGGAAHVLGLARLVMGRRMAVRLRVLIPAVENAVSGRAFRPGDVLATRKGLTVEIGNTDAEGRLVLADALALAGEEEPRLLLDFATLTGAARVALGADIPALFTRRHDLADSFAKAAEREGDPLWRLPLWQPYLEDLSSPIADIANASDSSFAGAITAGLFLSRFVDDDAPWVHFDVYAWNQKARPGRPAGGEAMALRAAYRVIEQRFKA